MVKNRFDGKVAIVTGGGTGIGAETARRIASEGGKVVVTGRRPEPIQKIAAEIGGLAVSGDAADVDHINDVVAQAVEKFGGLDVLVNNAASGFLATITEVDVDEWKRCMDLILFGALHATRAAIPHMRKRGGGAIVNVSSSVTRTPVVGSAAYESAKIALNGLSRSIAVEFGREGIRSNTVCVGMTRTDMLENSLRPVADAQGVPLGDFLNGLCSAYPLGRIGEASEIASAIAFLASDDSSFITAAELMADGGSVVVNPATF